MPGSTISRLKDPLKHLPYDVWLECIHNVIARDPAGPLSVLEVSQDWMNNLMQSPEIWNTVYIDGGHDQRARIETFLFLSNPTQINLVVQTTYGDVSHILIEIARRVPRRIRSFVFGRGTTPDGVATMLKEATAHWGSGCFTDIITVEIATYEVWDPIVPQILSACPNLQTLRGVNVPMQEVASLPRSMRDVSLVSGSTDRWPSLDYRTSRLQGVNIIFDAPVQVEPYVFPPILLQRLMIGWGHGAAAPFQGFANNSCHTLTRLELDINWHDIAFVIPHLSSWPSLRFLFLELDHRSSPPSGWTPPIILHPDMAHIHHFVLLMTASSSNNLKYIEDVLHMFTEHSPLRSLKQMRLRVTRDRFPQDLALRFLDSLTSVENLVVRLALRKEASTGKIMLPNLTVLQLDDNSDLLQYIEAPKLICIKASSEATFDHPIMTLPASLTSLKIQSHIFWNHCLRIASDKAHSLWPELQRIKWTPHSMAATMNLSYLSALVEVSFGKEKSPPINSEVADQAFDEFLQELIHHPGACLRLTTIKSACYPQWSLLLSVIHRRRAEGNFTRIDTIHLPSYPQVAILQSLVSCLSATDAVGSDPAQIFYHFDEMILLRKGNIHLLRRACLYCIKAGYVGCRPVGAGTLPEQKTLQIYNRLGTPVEAPPQPSTVIDPKHSKNIRKGTDEFKHRLGICRRHNLKDLVRITAYTLSGVAFDDF